ncbi:MAG: hypothetical protein RIR94_1966 [Bacteroidota bacterium]|jgi:N-acetylneuraminate synthase
MDIWSRLNEPKPYFIADVGANHDGKLERALSLIELAKESGADAVKFQNFFADTIVSDHGFKSLPTMSHQKNWNKSVYDIYKGAELDLTWMERLKAHCVKFDIDFFTSPYDIDVVDQVDTLVDFYKIGSGDITWLEIQSKIASKNKPVLIATGASDMQDVKRAIRNISEVNQKIVLMQCNTNYTLDADKYKFVNLNVIETFRMEFPGLPLGLSDHTLSASTALGAIAKGAFIIEKHFTDDNNRTGPDHPFAINPSNWSNMVKMGHEIAAALGDGVKRVEENEKEAQIVQQRSIRANRRLEKDEVITEADLSVLRPCSNDGVKPYEQNSLLGRKVATAIEFGEEITFKNTL